jgi:hypothetical protein
MGLLMANAPINISDNEQVNQYDFIQKQQLLVVTSTPIITNIRVGQPYLFNSGGVWFQTKIGTDTFRVQLNKV